MGILLMNIIGFAMPEAAYLNPGAYGGEGLADKISWAFTFLFVDNKMRGLFSVLFGASMLLVFERAEARDGNGAQVHMRRMVWLLVFGLIHYFLIWQGDILALYAICGFLGMVLLTLDDRGLRQAATALFLIGFLMLAAVSGWMHWIAFAAQQPGANPADVEAYRDLLAEIGGTDHARMAKEVALFRGDYVSIIRDRALNDATGPLELVFLYGAETLGLMASGMVLLRNGFLTGQWTMGAYLKIAGWAYAAGLAGLGALLGICIASGFDHVTVTAIGIAWSMPFRLLVTLGHAALAMALIRRFAGSGLMARIAAAGQAAFTNYLGTSILMTTLFYGYGFALFGQLSRWQLYLIVPPVWAIMLLWSKPWLDRYRYGPLEWMWRSLARGEVQPLRR